MCNHLGTSNATCPSEGECRCEMTSGQCQCLPNVVGQNCDRCAPNTWNLASGTGCHACDCSRAHSFGTSCNEASPGSPVPFPRSLNPPRAGGLIQDQGSPGRILTLFIMS